MILKTNAESLPRALVAEGRAADGGALIEVGPKGDGNDEWVLGGFAAAVRGLAGEASGTPIAIVRMSSADRRERHQGYRLDLLRGS